MEKYYRYIYYVMTASVVVFAMLYIWAFLINGQFAKASIEIINKEPYSIHLSIYAKSQGDSKRLFVGSIEQGKSKSFEQFIYGTGTFEVKLNKKFDFSIGEFDDKNNVPKTLIIKNNIAYFTKK
ncbi:MAG: hypothetical protein HRU28_14885 [Rhizobiales bacterium]|nr:hypothetical protein [Hyphomicrobiales bacterium]